MYKKRELKKLAYLAGHHKKRLVNQLEKLNISYKAGYISKEDYEQKLTILLKGRNVDDWLNYYDKYKSKCVDMIREDDKDTKFRVFMFILLAVALVFPYMTNYTGMVVNEKSNIIEINKIVSPEAYLFIDGHAEPIPKKLTIINNEYVYDIDYLELDPNVNVLQIVDKGEIVFSQRIK